jgi:hypothetical protein
MAKSKASKDSSKRAYIKQGSEEEKRWDEHKDEIMHLKTGYKWSTKFAADYLKACYPELTGTAT